jgi:hypothetical protein
MLVTPATKSKPLEQNGTTKMSGCNKLRLLCTGPVSRDAGEQSAGANGHIGGMGRLLEEAVPLGTLPRCRRGPEGFCEMKRRQDLIIT